MNRAPINYRRRSLLPEQLARIRQIERRFHVRVFGEELARVNLEFTIEQRRDYLGWMRQAAEKTQASAARPPTR
jgi:hypothetical protein